MAAAQIALVIRGNPAHPVSEGARTAMGHILEGFAVSSADAELVVFGEEMIDAIRDRLLTIDGVLVWIDPIVGGRERTALDALLREIAAEGVFVSAHPDVIMKMGTKEVLYRTREMPWGTDTHLYRSLDELRQSFPLVLRSAGPRVLKQDRGSGGNGVWKVEFTDAGRTDETAMVRAQHGIRGSVVEELPLPVFIERCSGYFEAFGGAGRMVDQPYADRLGEGMIRAYMVRDRVAGFGHQFVTALMPPVAGEGSPPDPAPRLYYGPDKPEFQRVRSLLESGWLAEMCRVLDVEPGALPIIWDADFLLGPKTATGEDTYTLCEVNVSGVFPIPDECAAPLAAAAVESAREAKRRRLG